MDAGRYPWYETTEGEGLAQGDILEGCPVFLPPADLDADSTHEATFRWESRDIVVLNQSCDLESGREKVKDVLLCTVWARSRFTTGHLSTPKGLEDARRGNLPGLHVLAACGLAGWEREVRVVDFRLVHSLPLGYVRQRAARGGERLRLLPPYREHLSQAFARFFMRVGLPVDIPPFR